MTEDPAVLWRQRLNTASAAQARYLWLLLPLGAFYWWVHTQAIRSYTPPRDLTVPVLDLPLPTLAVWASGPPVMFFVLLVALGTLRAYTHAKNELGKLQPIDATTDQHPNAIDWAAFSTEATPRWLTHVLGYAYPLYLSVFATEAGWLLISVATTDARIQARWLFVSIAGAEALPTILQIGRFWFARFQRLITPSAG